GPVLGDLHILLLEDDVALGVGDLGGALFPFQFVVRRDARLGEVAAEGQALRLLLVGLFGGWDGQLLLNFGHDRSLLDYDPRARSWCIPWLRAGLTPGPCAAPTGLGNSSHLFPGLPSGALLSRP